MLRQTQNEHQNHEEHFAQKEEECGVVKVHVDPLHTPLINSKHDDNPDKDSIKLKFCRDPTSEKSDLYELKMSLFYNGDQK